jgi:hypothetical protein
MRRGRTFRSGRMRPADGPSNGSATLSRIRSLADYTIAMLESSLRKRQGSFPDAQFGTEDVFLDLEIRMALDQNKKMFDEWRELRVKTKQGQVVPITRTLEERQESAREAIPRAVKRKADKNYAEPPTLLIYTDDGRALTAPELARLTMPWKDRFPAIYLLCGMDVVEAWPELHVLKGKGPF